MMNRVTRILPLTHAHPTRGFLLPTVLGFLAVISLVIVGLIGQTQEAQRLVETRQKWADAMIAMEATRAELLFRFATKTLTSYGLGSGPNAIRLDGRWYRSDKQTEVAIQDNRGLINFNAVGDDRLIKLFTWLGVPANEYSTLIDVLRDYRDADDLRRLNGAESREYETLGLPPPRNNDLVTPFELRNLPSWRDRPEFWEKDRLLRIANTANVVGINPNTTSKDLLMTIPEFTLEIADKIIAVREQSPIMDPSNFRSLTGLSAEFYLSFISPYPADTQRITQQSPDLPWAIEYNLTLTPLASDAPWRINYAYRRAPANLRETTQPLPLLPALAD